MELSLNLYFMKDILDFKHQTEDQYYWLDLYLNYIGNEKKSRKLYLTANEAFFHLVENRYFRIIESNFKIVNEDLVEYHELISHDFKKKVIISDDVLYYRNSIIHLTKK